MPVALLNEIILMAVGMIIGYKVGRRKEQATNLWNKFKGKYNG